MMKSGRRDCMPRSSESERITKVLRLRGSFELHHIEIGFSGTAVRACPRLGHILPASAGRDAILGVALRFIVDITANTTYPLLHEISLTVCYPIILTKRQAGVFCFLLYKLDKKGNTILRKGECKNYIRQNRGCCSIRAARRLRNFNVCGQWQTGTATYGSQFGQPVRKIRS
jgi:hypothetical protein